MHQRRSYDSDVWSPTRWKAIGLAARGVGATSGIKKQSCGDESIVEAVPVQAFRLAKAILKLSSGERLVVGQGGDTIAEVARRQQSQIPAQTARTPRVVGDRDDGCDVVGVLLQAPKECREAGAAAYGYQLGSSSALPMVVDDVNQAALSRRTKG